MTKSPSLALTTLRQFLDSFLNSFLGQLLEKFLDNFGDIFGENFVKNFWDNCGDNCMDNVTYIMSHKDHASFERTIGQSRSQMVADSVKG